jgi:hypothetical protein
VAALGFFFCFWHFSHRLTFGILRNKLKVGFWNGISAEFLVNLAGYRKRGKLQERLSAAPALPDYRVQQALRVP